MATFVKALAFPFSKFLTSPAAIFLANCHPQMSQKWSVYALLAVYVSIRTIHYRSICTTQYRKGLEQKSSVESYTLTP